MEKHVCKHGREITPYVSTDVDRDKHNQITRIEWRFCPDCNAETIAAIALRNSNAES